MNQIEVASVNKAKVTVEKVLNSFWNETNAKLNKFNINSMQIKSEPIEFDFNLNHSEINQNSFTPICTKELVKQENEEPNIDLINKVNVTYLKLRKSQQIKQTQIQQRVHLIKRQYIKFRSTQKAKSNKSKVF